MTADDRAAVDIGIPTRGLRRNYLQEAIDSVVAQTYSNWRLVLCDSSTEADAEEIQTVLRPYLDDARVHYLRVDPELSQAKKQTLLIERATAPYVAILHDDDRWDPEFLARRVAFLDQHPQCGYVFGDHKLIDEHGTVLGVVRHELPHGLQDTHEYVPRLLFHIGKPKPPTALVRRRAYEEVGPYFDERFPGFDYEMWVRLAVHAPAGYLPVADADWRLHATQYTYAERWGENHIVHYHHIQELVERELPSLKLRWRDSARRRYRAYFAAAADAVEESERRVALRRLARAVSSYPPTILYPRVLALALLLALGGPGRRLLRRGRVHFRRTDARLGHPASVHDDRASFTRSVLDRLRYALFSRVAK